MPNVIIVEDDLMVTSISKKFIALTPNLNVIACFHNGKEALAYLKVHPVDLAILDVYMPILNGIQLLTEIRKRNIATDVIMVTAANDVVSLDTALKLGIIDYLVKPFEYNRFKEALNKFIQQYTLLHNMDELSQSAIDSLVSHSPHIVPSLKKGLQEKTLERIRNYMRSSTQALTSEDIASKVGLSKVTIRRYMNYMIETKEILSEIDYETGGRPSIKFKITHQTYSL